MLVMIMKIKDITSSYPITRKALLIYEERGFIHPSRDLSGYRDYCKEDVEIIKKIILLRKLDFSLDEIENILNGHFNIIDDKGNEFDKEIHFIETKKSYLDYIKGVLSDEYRTDEAIEAIDETLNIYKDDSYLDMIHFDYHRDALGIMWIGTFLIALLSEKLSLILGALVLGIIVFVLSLNIVRKWMLMLPMKNIFNVLLMICGIGIWCLYINKPDNFMNDMIGSLALECVMYVCMSFKSVKDFFNKYKIVCSFCMLLLGVIGFAILFVFDVEGVLGMSLCTLSLTFIILSFIYNKYLKQLLNAFLDVI